MIIIVCDNERCIHHMHGCGEDNCVLPTIALDKDGKCIRFKDKYASHQSDPADPQKPSGR